MSAPRRSCMIVAIDPGPVKSALVTIDDAGEISSITAPNAEILAELQAPEYGNDGRTIAIEMIASYGMPVGAEVFDTCVWIGRFLEASGQADTALRIKRIEVKSHLCHSGKAKDANVRQAILDRYGGKDAAIGRKANPGPLYGVTGDEWAALAVALVVLDRQQGRAAA